MRIIFFILYFIGFSSAALAVQELMPNLTESVLSKSASSGRNEKWGGQVFSFSRNLAGEKNVKIGNIGATFASFEGEEQIQFIEALRAWWISYDYEVSSTIKSEVGNKMIKSFSLKGPNSDVFITVILLERRKVPSVIYGPRGSVDDYLITYQEILREAKKGPKKGSGQASDDQKEEG